MFNDSTRLIAVEICISRWRQFKLRQQIDRIERIHVTQLALSELSIHTTLTVYITKTPIEKKNVERESLKNTHTTPRMRTNLNRYYRDEMNTKLQMLLQERKRKEIEGG